MIGAGSVVTKDVPNNVLCYGNPARQVGFVCNCGYKLYENFHCISCDEIYQLNNDKLYRIDNHS